MKHHKVVENFKVGKEGFLENVTEVAFEVEGKTALGTLAKIREVEHFSLAIIGIIA